MPSVSDLQLDWRNQVLNKRSKMNYQRRRSDDTDSTNKRMATSKPNRLRELARLRSLSIQPLSPSSKSEKHHRESSFTFTDNEVECRSPAPETDDVSICMSPSQGAVEARWPNPITPVENLQRPPSRFSQRLSPLSPSEGSQTILDSPRMKNLRMQHQQRSVLGVATAHASLRRAQHYRRSVSNSRDQASPGATSSQKASREQRNPSTGRSKVGANAATKSPVSPSAAASLQRARQYRAKFRGRSTRTNAATRKAVPSALTIDRSRSPVKPSNTNLTLELNDSEIFTDFHLVMMAASSDSSIATYSSGESQSVSERRKKLMGRKFKTISKSKPSHHNAIARLVTQKSKSKSTYVPISQLCQYIVPIQTLARTYLAKCAVEKRLKRIVLVQALIRRWSCRHYLSKCRFVAIQIQACQRGYKAREKVICLHAKTFVATELQACYRGAALRSALRYQALCATIIQSAWRGYRQHALYGDILESVVVIQSVARMRSHRKLFLFVQNARLTLEASILAARKEEAATQIQTFWRTSSARIDFCDTVVDIVIVQSVLRRWSANRKAKQLQVKRDAATRIQSWLRGRVEFHAYSLILEATLLIQSIVRREHAMRKLDVLREERCQQEMSAATMIAAEWRRHVARSEYFNTVIDIIICQTVIRRVQAIKKTKEFKQAKEKAHELLLNASATLIQRHWKEWRLARIAARILYQEQLERSAATKIGATWRRFVCQEEYRLTVEGKSCSRELLRSCAFASTDLLSFYRCHYLPKSH